MRYRDIIDRMKRDGHHHEADEYERALERNWHHEWDHVPPWDAADGAAHTYAGDMAERAARYIAYDERREEERREEQEAMERDARRRQEAEAQRLSEEEYSAQVEQEQERAWREEQARQEIEGCEKPEGAK